MARQLGISRPTVYAYLRRGTPPGPRRRSGRHPAAGADPVSPLPDPPLARERRRQPAALAGDSGARLHSLRPDGLPLHHAAATGRRRGTPTGVAALAIHPPPGAIRSCGVVCDGGPAAKRSAEAQTYLDQLCEMDARITRAYRLTQGFLALVRERRGSDLEAWMTAATDSGIDALARFARGLQEDLTAVTAGLTLPWSNGPVEGQITRLKLLKRQGYGRAGSALLRQRVLQAA